MAVVLGRAAGLGVGVVELQTNVEPAIEERKRKWVWECLGFFGVWVIVVSGAGSLTGVSARLSVNVAVTLFVASAVIVHCWGWPETGVQLGEKPTNSESAPAAAVSVTTVFLAKLSLQSAPQSMPAGVELTAPDPLPSMLTVRVRGAQLTATETVAVPLGVLLSL